MKINNINSYSYNAGNNQQNQISYKGWVDMPWGFDDAPKGSKWSDVINFCWKDEVGIDTEITTYPRGENELMEGNSQYYRTISKKLAERGLEFGDVFEKNKNDKNFEKYKNASEECLNSSKTVFSKAKDKRCDEILDRLKWQNLWLDIQKDKRKNNEPVDYDKIQMSKEKISFMEEELHDLSDTSEKNFFI